MSELAYLDWCTAAQKIRDKQLSPVEYCEAQLGRIEALDSQLNTVLHLCSDRALAQAKAAEQAVMDGAPLGPLHGVPYGLKDIIDVAGLPTTVQRERCWHRSRLSSNVPNREIAC